MSVTTLGKERHKEIMRLKERGVSQRQIAGQLHIYESAVFHHLQGRCKCESGEAESDAAAATGREAQG